jgi:hypothetical protein
MSVTVVVFDPLYEGTTRTGLTDDPQSVETDGTMRDSETMDGSERNNGALADI